MGSKKIGKSGKRPVKRIDPEADKKKKIEKSKPRPVQESKQMPERIKEKDAGFGVIRIVAGVVVALIVGSMFLFNQAGGDQNARGDKIPGERCSETVECESGTVCYSYKDQEKRCMQLCDKKKECEPGYTCVSATEQKRRRGFRITDICVEDADI